MTSISRRVFGVIAGLALAALTACNLENLEAPGLAKDKDQAAREVYARFRSGDLDPIRPRFGPEMQGPEADAAMPQIVALIPKAEPTKVRLLSWKSNWSALSGPRTENLVTTHEYSYPDIVVSAETVMTRDYPAQGQPGPWMIRGFHIKRDPVGGAAATPAAAAPGSATGETESFSSSEARQDEIGPPPGETGPSKPNKQ